MHMVNSRFDARDFELADMRESGTEEDKTEPCSPLSILSWEFGWVCA